MNQIRSVEATVVTEHDVESGLSVARFVWPEGSPDDTYTLDVNEFVSLALDKHSTVRPDVIKVYDEGFEESKQAITALVGEEVTDALESAQKVGLLVIDASLSSQNRAAIAELQSNSPSSPELIRFLSGVMSKGNATKGDELSRAFAFPRVRGATRVSARKR